MVKRIYYKFYNSQSTTEQYYNQLSETQKKKLHKLHLLINDHLDSFKEKSDIAYSLLLHLLENKIVIEEKETVKKELCALQTKPFEKIETDPHMFGEVKW